MKINFSINPEIINAMECVSHTFDRVLGILKDNPNNIEQVEEILSDTLNMLIIVVKTGFTIH